MGIRMYQEVGLNPEAESFLAENGLKKPGAFCPNCSHILSYTLDSKVYEKKDSFYGDGPNLREINLVDGRIAREVVQTEPWSSGPVAFFCLEIDGVRMFEWSEKEIIEQT